MNLLERVKYLSLLVSASSTRVAAVTNMFGDRTLVGVNRAATHELARPPFILSAPTEKREWTQKEINEFYQNNPAMIYGK